MRDLPARYVPAKSSPRAAGGRRWRRTGAGASPSRPSRESRARTTREESSPTIARPFVSLEGSQSRGRRRLHTQERQIARLGRSGHDNGAKKEEPPPIGGGSRVQLPSYGRQLEPVSTSAQLPATGLQSPVRFIPVVQQQPDVQSAFASHGPAGRGEAAALPAPRVRITGAAQATVAAPLRKLRRSTPPSESSRPSSGMCD
jgi:hypothetical protein